MSIRPGRTERSSEPLPAPPRSVALVLMSAIGDVVHGMPVVASLGSAWPETKIDWILQPTPHQLVYPHPAVSEFLLFRRRRGLRGFMEFVRRYSGRRYDLVIVAQTAFKAGLIAGLLDAPLKLGFDRARARELHGLFTTHRLPPGRPAHVQDRNFGFLEYLGVPAVARWDFEFNERERAARAEFFGRIGRPTLAVAVASSDPRKDWPPERYARLLEIAGAEHGLRAVLVGSGAEAERARAAEVARLTGVPVVNALADDLRRLAWILDGCDLAVAPDTGPLHIASALGTPVIGLYGCTDPARSGPYREEFRNLIVDRYTRTGDSVPSREFRPGNMERITVKEVAEKLALAADRYL